MLNSGLSLDDEARGLALFMKRNHWTFIRLIVAEVNENNQMEDSPEDMEYFKKKLQEELELFGGCVGEGMVIILNTKKLMKLN